FRPAFKDWAALALPRDSSYTPRTLCALGAVMDVSKVDLDRAKMKSVKVFPADHSLISLTGYLATGQRWLSIFLDGHLSSHLPSTADKNTIRDRTLSLHSVAPPAPNYNFQQLRFAARFIMAFDDTSRIVVSEGSPPAAGSPPPSAGKRADKSSPSNKSRPKSGRAGAAISGGRHRHGKPDGFGSISCVHTFPTGLVVSTGSDGTVRMEYVVDAVRDSKQRVVRGFAPKVTSAAQAR
ncbi:unnamed protein product, partial [Sphacelaria rigidula]